MVWPPPPETPRVAFVMEIRRSQDLFRERGVWAAVKAAVGGEPDTRLVRPSAVALHPLGGLLVADPGRRGVHWMWWARGRYRLLGEGRARSGGLPSPVGVAALPDGRILVSDSRLGMVLSFSPDGEELPPFAGPEAVQRPAGLAVAEAAAGGSGGEVFVADVLAHDVKVFDFSGRRLRTLGRYGGGQGEFNFPTHLVMGPDGLLYVTDSMNFRVQVLTPDGRFVRAVGTLGDAPGQFSKPKGVAVDETGRLIAVEGLYSVLVIFDGQGRLLMTLGGPGQDPGRFWLPAGVCVDRVQGLVFVADSYNSRVQVFRFLEPQRGARDEARDSTIATARALYGGMKTPANL
ncbi:MAG: 6-bladed beta-propeller [Candidatus Sumerlaeia bacterium]